MDNAPEQKEGGAKNFISLAAGITARPGMNFTMQLDKISNFTLQFAKSC